MDVHNILNDAGSAHEYPTPKSSTKTLEFYSTDLERTEEFLSSSYAPMRIGSATGRSGAHIARVASDTVSIDQISLG